MPFSIFYQVSFIDSWLLCRLPIKRFLLWTMKKPNHQEGKDALQKQMVYSFGDHYYFRKELKILNLLTGYRNFCLLVQFMISQMRLPFMKIAVFNISLHRYIFLLDNFGRVRWQGFGVATKDELSSLISCTSLLLDGQ